MTIIMKSTVWSDRSDSLLAGAMIPLVRYHNTECPVRAPDGLHWRGALHHDAGHICSIMPTQYSVTYPSTFQMPSNKAI
jgi:hypothetical protein